MSKCFNRGFKHNMDLLWPTMTFQEALCEKLSSL